MEPAALGVVVASCSAVGALFAHSFHGVRPAGRLAVGLAERNNDEVSLDPPNPPPATGPGAPVPQVVVRLLGPVAVEVDGQPISSPSVVELVAYLVTHRQGVSDERLRTALWPERVVSGATFNNLVSLARGQLGRAEDGSLNLPHAEGRRYRVEASVVSDWEQLTAATKAVASSPSTAAVAELEGRVLGVAGIPFEAVRGFEWAHEEGLAPAASLDVSRAVNLVVAVLREGGFSDRAERASLAAMRACSTTPG